MRSSRTRFAVFVGSLIVAANTALAQPYPAKVIRLVAASAPGGALDLTARTVGAKMTESGKQTILVENRSGASGVLGTDFVAKARPDGYTVLLAPPAPIAVLPHLHELPYSVGKDLAPISLGVTTPLILVVHPSLPVTSVKQLVAFSMTRPGQIAYASTGTGSIQHLAGELLKITMKLDMVHVPFKGAGEAMPAVIGGHVPLFFSGLPPALPQVRSGKLRALAITSTSRSPAAPDFPTMTEAGVPGFVMTNWFAFFAPAGTPAGAISWLNREINQALKLSDVRDQLAKLGAEPAGTSAEGLGKFVSDENNMIARLIKVSGAKGTD